MKLKLCTVCGERKPATIEFFYWNDRDDCLQSQCKSCRSLRAKGKVALNKPARRRAKVEREAGRLADVLRAGARTCSKCEQTKPLSEFKKNRSCVAGRSLTCRVCGAKDQRAYKARTEKTKWALRLCASTRITARQKGYTFALTVEQLQEMFESQQGRCYWFNVPLLPTHEHKHPQKPSVDRLDATKGYTPDNVVLCCYTANIGRNTSTADTFRKFVEVLKQSLATLPPAPP